MFATYIIQKMENFNTIEQVLDTKYANSIHKAKNSLLPGTTLLIIGTIMIVLPSMVELSAISFLPSLLLMLGIITGLTGIAMMAFRKTYYVSASNKQKLKSFDINFDVAEKEKLIQMVNTGKISNIHSLKRSESNGLRLKVMATADLSLCFSQVIAYVPFDDVPHSEAVQHSLQEANYLKELQH